MIKKILCVSAAGALLSGCALKAVADTAARAAKVPVKAASAGVDAATTSQSEADENRGREIRKREERLGKAERKCTRARAEGRYDAKYCPIADGEIEP